MRVLQVLAAVALASGCAGCASVATSVGATAGGSRPVTSLSASLAVSPVNISTLTVRVAMFGGPMNTDGHMAASNSPMAQAVVTVTGPDESKRTATTAANGVATLQLPPGRYQVTASCGNSPHPVSLVAGGSVSVQVDCDVP
jgi:Carboxypeptidase regulatory-like domain